MLVLLDRDGVLNEDRQDSVKAPEELVLIKGSVEAVATLKRAGHFVVVVTNQSVVGRGIINHDTLDRIHEKLGLALSRAGGRLDDILVCPDPPWAASERRKPAPGMLNEAISRFAALPTETVMIGDALRDLQAAAAAGCQRILVLSGKGRKTLDAGLPDDVQPVAVYDDLAAASDGLLSAQSSGGSPTVQE